MKEEKKKHDIPYADLDGDDIRMMGFTQMDRRGFVIYDAFNAPLLTVDNTEWPPKVIHIYDRDSEHGFRKWEYIPKE